MCPQVDSQLVPLRKPLLAYLTLEWTLACVHSTVDLQGGLACKLLNAEVALERLLTGVCALVNGKVMPLGEFLEAYITLQELLSSMDPTMNLQVVTLSKLLVAVVALVTFSVNHHASIWTNCPHCKATFDMTSADDPTSTFIIITTTIIP